MENEDYDKAKTLTANDSNYKDLYKDLEAYLMVVNDIQMRYVHAKFDDSEDSEFEECAEKLEGIPNEYKKYSKFKAKIKLYKEELQKAISLEKKFQLLPLCRFPWFPGNLEYAGQKRGSIC